MHLTHFFAQRFRNLHELNLAPAAKMNVIYGDNAQGKTNLLEAVYVLSTLRSFRTRALQEAVQFGEPNSLLEGILQSGQSRHVMTVQLEGGSKSALLDRKKVQAPEYVGFFHAFLFSFPLLEVIRGGPEERRKFLDRSIAMSRHGYLPALMNYHRALKQKTALLVRLQRGEMNRREGIASIAAFNQQLLQHGLEVLEYRTVYLDQLEKLLREKQPLFFEKDVELALRLRSSFLKEGADKKLEEAMDAEIARGSCLVGVHRDEIRMSVNDRELRKYGSSGQHRAFLLLLLLAQLELYETLREDKPVLLLDDLDSELDQKKIQAFLSEVRNRYQTLISSSRRELFGTGPDVQLFEIRSGALLEM